MGGRRLNRDFAENSSRRRAEELRLSRVGVMGCTCPACLRSPSRFFILLVFLICLPECFHCDLVYRLQEQLRFRGQAIRATTKESCRTVSDIQLQFGMPRQHDTQPTLGSATTQPTRTAMRRTTTQNQHVRSLMRVAFCRRFCQRCFHDSTRSRSLCGTRV